MDKPDILIKTLRASIVEREHAGFVIVVDKNKKIVKQVGNCNNRPFLLRSAQKPFQAIPILETGAYKEFRLEPKHLAICCGSHTGTFDHTELVREILFKSNIDEKALKCGIHPPLDKETRHEIIKNEIEITQLNNNCSGKHAGMLATCSHMGWNINTYLDIKHPLQEYIVKRTKELCEINTPAIAGLDGCDAPVLSMPLYNLAVGFNNLTLSESLNLIIKSCCTNPIFFGGEKRLDSEIIQATNGRIFSKVGAEGLCVATNTESTQTLVVKITDANMDARARTIIEAMKQLGWISSKEYNILDKHYPKKILTLSSKAAGKYDILFKL